MTDSISDAELPVEGPVRNYYGRVELDRRDGVWLLRLPGHSGNADEAVVSEDFARAWFAEFSTHPAEGLVLTVAGIACTGASSSTVTIG